jgi:hypothetical protein
MGTICISKGGDLEFCDSGMRVYIRRSKTDQEGAGHTIAIVSGSIACPVKAVRAWERPD